MASKLKEAKGGMTLTSSSTTITDKIKEDKEPPAGSKILSQTITTNTEQIENGWLVSKNYDIKYEKDKQTNWTYYSKKWYSKEDPLTIKLNDKSLAEEFTES